MLKFNIIAIDKIRSKEIRSLTEIYSKRLSREYQLDVTELKPCNKPNYTETMIIEEEGERLCDALERATTVVVLDERGAAWTSTEFAHWIEGVITGGESQITFVIGGAAGLSDKVRNRATKILRLSSMTMVHEFARLFLIEQLYRATTILAGHPYHK